MACETAPQLAVNETLVRAVAPDATGGDKVSKTEVVFELLEEPDALTDRTR